MTNDVTKSNQESKKTMNKKNKTRKSKKNQARKNVLAFGGGVDSTCLLAMHLRRDEAAAILGITRRKLDKALPDFDAVVFSDTGAEFAYTYANVETAKGLCAENALEFVTVRKEGESITEWVMRLGIVPVMAGGAHVCSVKFKGEVMAKWAADEFGSADLVTWAIGIEADEGHRVTRFKTKGKTDSIFPLVTLGIDREKAEKILAALWPTEVKKSSCVFCPFMSEGEIKNLASCSAEFEIAKKVEKNFEKTSAIKHQRWLDEGKPVNKAGRALRGMWRRNSYADGARLFVKKVNGKQLSIDEWTAKVDA